LRTNTNTRNALSPKPTIEASVEPNSSWARALSPEQARQHRADRRHLAARLAVVAAARRLGDQPERERASSSREARR
jgi:hypothetical protein